MRVSMLSHQKLIGHNLIFGRVIIGKIGLRISKYLSYGF
jgi:hypothetical protein